MRSKSRIALVAARLFFAASPVGTAFAADADYTIRIDAIRQTPDRPVRIASYRIHSSNPKIDETTVRFREVARHLKTALSGHGLYESLNEAAADVIVAIDYGIERRPIRYKRLLVPIYDSDRSLPVRRPIVHTIDPSDPRGRPSLIEQDRPILAYRDVALPYETFEKYLAVTVRLNRPAAEGRPPPDLWRIRTSIDNTALNLRAMLPVLASAVMDFLGRETNGPAVLRIPQNSPAIAFIKQGL